jgi:Sgf11 (transcriptional regulation protein)
MNSSKKILTVPLQNRTNLMTQAPIDTVEDYILDDILSSIIIDEACIIHRRIKMGMFPPQPKPRLDLYSEVHANEEEMMAAIQKYSTEEPLMHKSNSSSEDVVMDMLDEQELEGDNSSSSSTGSMVVTRHQQNQLDIWNRIPPKEPKALAKCTICDRYVSALRFAPHLDKCMQLGTMRTGAASNSSHLRSPSKSKD